MLWGLFVSFFKIGLMSFGGGYAMLPVIQREVSAHQWMSEEQFVNAVALAGMAPGPIATNSATMIGYTAAGIPGAAISTLGMVLPSLLVVIAIAAFFYKIHQHPFVRASFYGLRPVVTGLVLYAAIHYAMAGETTGWISWQTALTAFMVVGAIVGMVKYRMHPLSVILLSGLIGIAFFQ